MNIHKQTGKAVNSGKLFEKQIQETAWAYERARILKLEKVDPPTRIIPSPKGPRIIYQKSTYLDFVGSWIEAGGRMVTIEVKSTNEQRLPMFTKSGGLTLNQWYRMRIWHHAGAATGVIWGCGDRARWFGYEEIAALRKAGAKSVTWGMGTPIRQGTGLILVDFIVNLRADYEKDFRMGLTTETGAANVMIGERDRAVSEEARSSGHHTQPMTGPAMCQSHSPNDRISDPAHKTP